MSRRAKGIGRFCNFERLEERRKANPVREARRQSELTRMKYRVPSYRARTQISARMQAVV